MTTKVAGTPAVVVAVRVVVGGSSSSLREFGPLGQANAFLSSVRVRIRVGTGGHGYALPGTAGHCRARPGAPVDQWICITIRGVGIALVSL